MEHRENRRLRRTGVYKITNNINGDFYIGSSIDIGNRWDQHRYVYNKSSTRNYLYNAFAKYGIENFSWDIVEECEPVKETIIGREQHYIDTLKPVYNIAPTAGSQLGYRHTDETLERLTAINKANGEKYRQGKTFEEIMGEEKAAIARAKQVEAKANAEIKCHAAGWNKGIPADPMHIQRMIEARDGMEPWNKGTTGLMPEPWNKGVEPTPEMLAQLIEVGFQPGMEPWNKGMIMSDEHCQRMSETAKEHFNPDHQATITEAARVANTGRKYSQEHCDAISEGNLNSAARKAYADSRRGVARSDELKQKVSEGIRSSAKFQASVQRRAGKKRADNTSGHYGIVWDKAREKWIARANKKSKRFATIEQAIQWRDEILAAA